MRDTRQAIIDHALLLFNRSGVMEISTNHIAASLSMSPGVLYYHFRNREFIVRDLFHEMSQEVEALWSQVAEPRRFFAETLRVFWKYRCFHREMVPLRRRDPSLNRIWFKHIRQSQKLLDERICGWNDQGLYPRLVVSANRRLAIMILLTLSSSALQTFESSLKSPRENLIDQAVQTLLDCLVQLGN